MKIRSILPLIVASTVATAAAQQSWDGSNTIPNGTVDGGTGTWNATTTNWTNPAGSTNDAFAPGSAVIFAGTPGTVTVGNRFTATPSGMSFNVGGYTVNSLGFININGQTPITTLSGETTISAPIGGSGALVKRGSGTLTLASAFRPFDNSYTGGTIVEAGTLKLGSGTGIPDRSEVTVTGGTLDLNGLSHAFTKLSGAGGMIRNTGGEMFIDQSSDTTVASAISGSGALRKSGIGTLTLSGNNTYSGGSRLEGGTLSVSGDSPIGGGMLTIGEGTTLQMTPGQLLQNNLRVEGDFTITSNAPPGSGTLFLSGAIDLGATDRQLTVGNRPMQIDGPISGTAGLTITGPKRVSIGGLEANTFTGLTRVTSGSELGLFKGSSVPAIGGDLLVDFGGLVTIGAGERVQQIPLGSTITINGRMDILLNPFSIGDLQGSGEIMGIPMFGDPTLTIQSGNFSGSISGITPLETRIRKTTSGTLVLSGSNPYRGGTDIAAGTLFVNGTNTGAGLTSVADTATLGGTGTINGPVTIANGGRLSPGVSVGTLTTGTLSLNPTSVLSYQLGSPGVVGSNANDLLSVKGDLVLDGILDVKPNAGFAAGKYRLIDYTGAITDAGLSFGTTPALFDLTVDTTTANQVNLRVAAVVAQFWDGSNTIPNGTVDGGTGTWSFGWTNWTNLNGTNNSTFDPRLVSTFAGTAGTATIGNGFTAPPRALDFQTPGYTIAATGTGTLALNTDTPIITTPGQTTISAPIIGVGTLVKQGEGNLVLTGNNTYTGGTTITSGTLEVTGSTRHISGDLTVGETSGDRGTFIVRDGGYLLDDFGFIGRGEGSTGTGIVDGASSLWSHSNTLTVGDRGTGTLFVQNQGSLSTREIIVGAEASGVGSVFVEGSGTSVPSSVWVGSRGTGQLIIRNGGSVTGPGGVIGEFATGSGSILIDGPGSKFSASGGFTVGQDGTGSLVIRNGGRLFGNSGQPSFDYVGKNAGSRGEVIIDGPSSAWTRVGPLNIGSEGTGSLTLRNGGRLDQGENAPILLGRTVGSVGSLNIGTNPDTGEPPSAAGILNASAIFGGLGESSINFNHTSSDYHFTTNGTASGTPIDIVGFNTTLSVFAGTTTLPNSGGRQGDTYLLGGTLRVGDSSSLGISPSILTFDGGNLEIFEPFATDIPIVLNTGGSTVTTTADFTIDSSITGPGALTKTGPQTLTLTAASTYTGGTTLDAGTLQTTNPTALGTGPVTLNRGTLDPVGTLTIRSLDWRGGTIATELGDSTERVDVRRDLRLDGTGRFRLTAGPGFDLRGEYLILTARNLARFDPLTDFIANQIRSADAFFRVVGRRLLVSFSGPPTGPILQNSAPVNTPTTADFTVNGPVRTGTIDESNTVSSLRFSPGSSLQVFNTLTVTSGEFDALGGTSLIAGGTVLAPSGFQKTGPGSLIASSTFAVDGPASVEAGALFVNGRFDAPGDLTVTPDALLGGAGLIAANVTNRGTVAPGNSPGTLNIAGDFTQVRSGTIQIEVASPSVFDRLIVSGTATLDGTLQAINLGEALEFGQQIPLLSASRITGDFDTITLPDPSRYRGRFLRDDGTGTLLIAPASYVQVAETQNQRNVARALDRFIPATRGDRETVSTALDRLTADQYPAAFDQIGPAFHQSIANISIQQAFTQTQMINQRLSAVRLGARGFQLSGIPNEPLTFDKNGKQIADPKDLKTVLTADPTAASWTAWAMGNGTFARVTSVSQVPNHRFDSGGFLLGADYDWAPTDPNGLTTGLFGGYQGTYADYDSNGSTRINSALFGGYASYVHGGFTTDAVLTGVYNKALVRRPIEFSTVERTARSRQEGGQVSGALNLGYDWQASGFTFGPILGGQYTYVGIAPFTETGADSLDLRVDQQNAHSLRTTLGGRVAYTVHLTDTIALIPEVRVLWQHEFLNNSRTIGAALDASSGPSFATATAEPGRDSVFAGAGVSTQIGDRWNASVYYNADFGRQDLTSHSISAALGWAF